MKSKFLKIIILCLFAFMTNCSTIFAVSPELARKELDAMMLKPDSKVQAFNSITKGQTDIFKLFIDAGMDINSKFAGLSFLHHAIQEKKSDIAIFLIDKGVDVNVKYMGSTPFYWAVYKKQPEIATYLLQKGADINVKYMGLTPFHWAVYKKQPEIAIYLLQKGANPNTKLYNGDNPLWRASLYGETEVVREILKNPGINIKQKPLFRSSPLKLARKKKYKEIEELLVNYQKIKKK